MEYISLTHEGLSCEGSWCIDASPYFHESDLDTWTNGDYETDSDKLGYFGSHSEYARTWGLQSLHLRQSGPFGQGVSSHIFQASSGASGSEKSPASSHAGSWDRSSICELSAGRAPSPVAVTASRHSSTGNSWCSSSREGAG
jgi:hypothetical protein